MEALNLGAREHTTRATGEKEEEEYNGQGGDTQVYTAKDAACIQHTRAYC